MNETIQQLIYTIAFFSVFQFIFIVISCFAFVFPYFCRKEREYKKKEFDEKVNKEVEKRISELEGYKDEK